MGSSFTAKALRRAAGEYLPAIRDALRGANSKGALGEATAYLRSEAAKRRKRDPAAGALIDAHLAGQLAGIAATLHDRKPVRPPGSPRVPRPADLLTVCEDALARALEGTGHGE